MYKRKEKNGQETFIFIFHIRPYIYDLNQPDISYKVFLRTLANQKSEMCHVIGSDNQYFVSQPIISNAGYINTICRGSWVYFCKQIIIGQNIALYHLIDLFYILCIV